MYIIATLAITTLDQILAIETFLSCTSKDCDLLGTV